MSDASLFPRDDAALHLRVTRQWCCRSVAIQYYEAGDPGEMETLFIPGGLVIPLIEMLEGILERRDGEFVEPQRVVGNPFSQAVVDAWPATTPGAHRVDGLDG